MKKYFTKRICLISILSGGFAQSFTQTPPELTTKLGSIKFETEEQQVIDKATLGVYYQFVQNIENDNKLLIITDTLLLPTGKSYSLFLDPYYKDQLELSRKQRIDQSKKYGRANFQNENIDDIADLINPGSNYQEEHNGNPTQIYKSLMSGEITSVYNAFADNLICEQQIEAFNNWIITNETDTVLNYMCQKATTSYAGREYTVWFTLDIPISDGPWKFHGLPGLILRAEDAKHEVRYIAIGIQQYTHTEIVPDKGKYEKCSLSQFNKFVDMERGRNRVSFFSGGQLYMTYKCNSNFVRMEVEE